MLKADRFVIQTILREYDDKGNPTGEFPQELVTAYGLDGLKKYERALVKKLAADNPN